MIGTLSPEEERRLYNTIWNGARKYGYEPEFAGLDIAGNPDFYMNLIIGAAYKYYGREELDGMFRQWKDHLLSGTYDKLAWFALEFAVYDRELTRRPILKSLRLDYAKNFMKDEYDLHRRNYALRDNAVFRLNLLKMNEILNGDPGEEGKREREIYELLRLDKSFDLPKIEERLLKVFTEYFHYREEGGKRRKGLPPYRGNFALILPRRVGSATKSGVMRAGELRQEEKTGGLLFNFFYRRQKKKEEEVVAMFGASMLSERRRLELEDKYCIGPHQSCSLWYTEGEQGRGRFSEEANLRKQDIDRQYKNNRRSYELRAAQYNRAIHDLTKKIITVLQAQKGSEEIVTRRGKLIGKLAWKSELPEENKIFRRFTEEASPGLSVDLLLDASASRMYYQEDVAIQSYILTMSLFRSGIPSRVISYASSGDFTVFTRLKDFGEAPDPKRLFRYYASGWNRDGLAYRGYREFLKERPSKHHLTIILTDAMPNDLKPMGKGIFAGGYYKGEKALEDTEKELAEIRKQRVNVCALVTGDENSSVNARRLFGNRFVKINSAKHISNVAGNFIKKEIAWLERQL